MEVVAPGTVIAGRYTIVEEIGRGGMGIVYRVEHAHTGEPLALKVLTGAARTDPQAVTRFKREARASGRIGSENVVRVTDADTAPELDGSPFFVMELLRGTDLEKYVLRHGPLPLDTLISVLTQVSSVLEKAHQLGIVHRDLKPENLFLHQRADGTTIAKVLDFGISKFVSAEGLTIETAGMTSTGSVLGTPLYMAPEQAHGQNEKIAPTTDVWAMGLVAMRLLTAEHYWGVTTMMELMLKIAVKDLIPPSERWPKHPQMSKELDAWFFQSVNRDQEKRFPSIATQIAELANALNVAVPSAVPSVLNVPVVVASDEPSLSKTQPISKPGTTLAYAETVAIPSTTPERSSLSVSDGMSAMSRSARTSSPSSRRLGFFGAIGGLALLGVAGFGYANFIKSRTTNGVVASAQPSSSDQPLPPAATSLAAPASEPPSASVPATSSSSPAATALRGQPQPQQPRPKPASSSSSSAATPPTPTASTTASGLYSPLAP